LVNSYIKEPRAYGTPLFVIEQVIYKNIDRLLTLSKSADTSNDLNLTDRFKFFTNYFYNIIVNIIIEPILYLKKMIEK